MYVYQLTWGFPTQPCRHSWPRSERWRLTFLLWNLRLNVFPFLTSGNGALVYLTPFYLRLTPCTHSALLMGLIVRQMEEQRKWEQNICDRVTVGNTSCHGRCLFVSVQSLSALSVYRGCLRWFRVEQEQSGFLCVVCPLPCSSVIFLFINDETAQWRSGNSFCNVVDF